MDLNNKPRKTKVSRTNESHYKIFIVLLAFIFLINNVLALSTTATVDFNSNVGQIRSDFYGASLTSRNWFGGTVIDLNGDGTRESNSNYTWHQDKFKESNMKYFRLDMNPSSFYSNGTQANGVNYTADSISNITRTVNFARTNDMKILFVTYPVPTWLLDNSTGKCNDNIYGWCPPNNITKYSNIILDYLSRIGCTPDVCELETWNEPYGSFFLGGFAKDQINKSVIYSQYHVGMYDAIKLNNSNWQVGGPSGYRDAPNMTMGFLTNTSNKFDFLSIHPYSYSSQVSLDQYNDLVALRQNCTAYGLTCNRFILSEWNVGDARIQNISANQTRFGMLFSTSLNSILNYLPFNVSMVTHLWSFPYNYSQQKDDYPFKYHMISEKGLDNEISITYNITKVFATNHKANNYVVTSSTDASTVKIVASYDSTFKKFITVTNTNTSSFNVTINGVTSGMKNVETGAIYPVNSGSVTILNMPSYGVYTLESINNTVIELFNTAIGTVRSDFYGVNMGGRWLLNTSTNIAKDGDGLLNDNYSDTFYKELLINIKTKTLRLDMRLHETTWNGSNAFFIYNENMKGYKYHVDYAKQNNMKIIFISAYMPQWLANNNSGYCYNTTTTNYRTCSPNNLTQWGIITTDFLKNVSCTPDVCLIEVWNEPEETGFWLNNLSTTNITRSIEYNKLFNATYNAIKNYNNSYQIIGPTTHIVGTANTNIWKNYMGNFSNTDAKFSFHYISTDYKIKDILRDIFNNCTTYNFNCTTIYNDEWKHKNGTEQNISSNWNKWSNNLASELFDNLEYPDKIVQLYYKLESGDKYNSNGTDYPLIAKLVSGPELDNTIYPPYNITKQFTRYAPATGVIYQTNISKANTTDTVIKAVSSKISGKQNLIVTNTENGQRNISLSCGSFTGNLIDVSSGQLYSCASGSVNLGVFDAYDVRYFTEPVESNGWYYNYLGEPIAPITGYSIGSTCDDTTLSFYAIILNMAALAIIGVVLYLLFKDGWEDITIQKILIAGIAIIVGVILFQSSADNLAIGNCP